MKPGLIRELVSWLPVGVIPIGNGTLRLVAYQDRLAEPWPGVLSSTLDIVLILGYAVWLEKRSPHPHPPARGLLWLASSTVTHFLLGLSLFGMSFAELLAKYAVIRGETWLVISVLILAAPIAAAALRRRSGETA